MSNARKAALHLLNAEWSRGVWKHWLSNIFLPPVEPPAPSTTSVPPAPTPTPTPSVPLPASQVSSERAKVWTARSCVMGFGLVAYLIALNSGSILELVETASAFGSSGIFVVGLFGLFSRLGGALSAYAALVVGMAVWAVGDLVLGLATPYLLSLACAFAAYVGAAWIRPSLAGS